MTDDPIGTGRIGVRRQRAGGVSGGVLGVPSGLVGTIYTQSNSRFRENPSFEKIGRFFLCTCGCGGLAQVRFWRPKRPHLERSHVVWQSPSSWDKKLQTFQKNVNFFF